MKNNKEECETCGQVDHGQTGEYPCKTCGLPSMWDDRESYTKYYYDQNDNLIGQQLIDLMVSISSSN